MRVKLSKVLITFATLALGAGVLGVVVLYTGFYDISATHQHLRPTYQILKVGLREGIERGARGIDVPPLDDPALARRGLALYREHCLQCHGAPGVAPAPFALGMTPLPANLSYSAKTFSAAELYWTVANGIKMSGMPAWRFRLSEEDMWAVVAFMRDLPMLSPVDYQARSDAVAPHRHPAVALREIDRAMLAAADPVRGKQALRQYACTTCHVVPGVVGDHSPVGPPLAHIATREYLAGVLPNTPTNMVRWLRVPQEVAPRSAMPNLGVSERDALDMAAYLYTLR